MGQLDKGVHSYDPGIAPNGVFWTMPIPERALRVDEASGAAELALEEVPLYDWTNVPNSVLHGTRAPARAARVSFRVRWRAGGTLTDVNGEADRFRGRYFVNQAEAEFHAHQDGFEYVSDPASSSQTEFAAVGWERNGAFYSAG